MSRTLVKQCSPVHGAKLLGAIELLREYLAQRAGEET